MNRKINFLTCMLIAALVVLVVTVRLSQAVSLFGTGKGLVAIPSGSGSKVTAFDATVDGGACTEYAVYNADTTNFIRVQVTGPSPSSTLQQGTDAALVPPNTIIVFKGPAIHKVTVWGEDASGNGATLQGTGFVKAKS